jgi:hypothetical protein
MSNDTSSTRRAVAGSMVAATLLLTRLFLLALAHLLDRVLGGGRFGAARRPAA